MSNVVVVESPAKAKTIEKYLGPGYKVLASFGHVRDLPSKDGSVDPDNDFAMNYQVEDDSEKNIKAIATAVAKADTLYLATDLDREGEAISWHVLEELKKRVKTMSKIQVKRIEFTEITKSAIKEAIANPRELAMPLVNAQQARRALDYLVGFNLSPVLWRKVRGGLSAGRVQSVALRLICEREAEIEAFKPEEYWSLDGQFSTLTNKTFIGKLALLNGEKVEKFTLTTEAQTQKALGSLQGLNYTVSAVDKKQTRRFPAAPFITSTLQQEASRKLGFGAKRTMMAAQRLYEAGHITYMRTDSVNLANEAVANIRSTIGTAYGKNYLPSDAIVYKSKSKNAQEAHEAIRPSNMGFTSEAAAGELENDQARLYDLIYKRTIACQMQPAVLDQTALTLAEASGKNAFRATGSVIVFDGFLRAYREGTDDDKTDDDETTLPAVNQGDKVNLDKMLPEQHFTEPPPRFSEATLVKALEEYGIGRPSTYASIISTLQDRGYVKQENKRFHPEDVGRVVSKFLVEHFAKYVDVNFTAEMEEELDTIARGEHDWKPVLRTFWAPFKQLVDEKTASVKKSDVTSEQTDEACPTCKIGKLTIRLGRYGKFKGCNRYPECKHTEPLEAPDPNAAPKAPPKDTGITCPKCKEGTIVERRSRKGKTFFSCSTYPKCDYACWDPPIAEPCPSCNWPIITLKTLKSGEVKKCPQRECGWQDPPAKEGEKKAYGRFAKKKTEAPAKKTASKTAAKKAPAKKKAPKKAV